MPSRHAAFMVFSLALILALSGGAIASSDDAPTKTDNWLDVTYALTISDDLEKLLLDGDVHIHLVERPDMGNPWINQAVENECGPRCSADDLRSLYQEHEDQQDALVQHLEDFIADQTRTVLESITNAPANVDATADRASLEEAPHGAPYHPPVPVTITGTSDLALLDDADVEPEQVFTLFEMGARAPLSLETPVDPGTNLTLSLDMVPPLTVLDTGEGTHQDETTHWTIKNWNNTDSTMLQDEARIGDPTVTVPTQERLDIDVTLDLSDIEVHYLNAITGDPPVTVHAAINLETVLYALEVPPTFETDVIELEMLSADALRIAMDAGLLEDDHLIQFEDEARDAIQRAFEGITGERVPVSGGFLTETLANDAIGTPVGTGDPIGLSLDAAASLSFPLEDDPFAGASAFEVTRIHHGTFELPEIPTPGDRPANVSLVLPPGIDLEFSDVLRGEATRGQTDDGLTVVTFTTGGEEGPTTVQGTEFVVNSPFLWDVLWPVFLLLFVVLVVLPGLAIVLFIRRRRRKAMDKRHPPSGRVSGGYKAGDSEANPPPAGAPMQGDDAQNP